jgi:hypothetical protein
VIVRVPEVDVDLYFANAEQLGEAVQWLWVVLGDSHQELPLSAEDAARTEELLQLYAPQRRVMADQAETARTAGRRTFTVELDLPERAGADFDRLLELLDLVNELVTEQGLALPASSQIREFRQMLLGGIARQLRAGGDR